MLVRNNMVNRCFIGWALSRVNARGGQRSVHWLVALLMWRTNMGLHNDNLFKDQDTLQ